MGNQVSGEVPDDVVIPDQPDQHGHSHQDHGHSHNGEACHGHGTSKTNHGHSHDGGDHGHSHAQGDHGHSHASPQAHGHSHNGVACHGHGGQQIPEAIQRKMKAIDVFMRVVVLPRLPIVFSKFSPADKPEPTTTVGGIEVPNNAKRSMKPEQFREFVRSIQQAIADADFHGVVRDYEVSEMEFSFYSMAHLVKSEDPSQELPKDFAIPQPLFINMAAFMVARLAAARYDSVKLLLIDQWGFNMKLPELPLTEDEVVSEHIRTFTMTQVAPVLTTFIEQKMKENEKEEDPIKRWAIRATLDSITEGMQNSKVESKPVLHVLKMIEELDTNMVLNQCLRSAEDGGVNPRFLAYVVLTNWASLMLSLDPDVAGHVFKLWGLDLELVDSPEGETTEEVAKIEHDQKQESEETATAEEEDSEKAVEDVAKDLESTEISKESEE